MERIVGRLVKLGFSKHEARVYAALLGESPVTGHRLAKLSGVPPSSIYEVAGRLVARGAAMVLRMENTDRYAPVPAVEFLERLRRERGRLIASLKEDLAALTSESDTTCVWNFEGYREIVEAAEEMIGKAKDCIRLAPLPAAFPALHPALGMAVRRGVRLVIHGSSGLGLPDSEVVIAPMVGVTLRRVEEASLILIVDGEQVLMGECGAMGFGHGQCGPAVLSSSFSPGATCRPTCAFSGCWLSRKTGERFPLSRENGEEMRDRLRSHRGLVVTLALYVAVAALYGATIPIFEAPDANGHYAYIHELTEGRGLPVHGAPSSERVTGYVAGHSPLYYLLSAAATFWVTDDADYDDWAWHNPYHAMGDADAAANKNRLIHTDAEAFPWRGTPLTMHIARLVSTALGALAVVATYGIALEFFPERRWLALGAAALTAFNPMFLFTAARVSNDAAGAAFGSLAVWGAVRLAVRGLSRRGLALAGAALGLAALSRLSGIVLGPAFILALLIDVLRVGGFKISHLFRRNQLVRLLVNASLLFGTTAIVCGWWFVRNFVLYGEFLGIDAWLSRTAMVRPEPIGFFDVIPQLEGLEMPYWAMFGWFNILGAPWMYKAWWALARLAGCGLLLILADQCASRRSSRAVQAGLAVLALSFLLVFGAVWRFIMIVPGAQGRYLMPVTAAISVLLVLGLDRLILRRFTPGLALFLGLGNLVAALICLFAFILPAYARPEVVTEDELPEDMTRFDVAFEGTPIQLLGGVIESEEIRPGETVAVSLYWRALEKAQEDHFGFVQILGRGAEPIVGVDCYPGRGNFPASLWQTGSIYRDRYLLPIAADAEAPAIAALHAGLHGPGGARLTGLLPSGDPAPELMVFDRVALRAVEPLPSSVTFAVGAWFDDAITLIGYDLSAEEVRPGETLTITLVWRAEAVPAGDYTVFVHLLDEDGNLVAQDDHPPLHGEYRTSFWAPGDVVRDMYQLTLEDSQPPCACTLKVGLYDSVTKVRISAHDGLGGHFEDDAAVVGGVAVR